MKKKQSLRITGREVPFSDIDTKFIIEDQDIIPVQAIEVNALRGTFESIDINSHLDDDIIDIVFEDGTEWIGSRMDFEEIYGQEPADRSTGEETNPEYSNLTPFISDDQNRGIKDLSFKLFNVFKVEDEIADMTGEKLANWCDQLLMSEPGLFLVDLDGGLSPLPADSLKQKKKYLLLLHGTFSSFRKSYAHLFKNQYEEWKKILDKYEGRVLALDHYTLSQSPLENAIELLRSLTTEIELDIISTSRGGIIADILALCDASLELPGFPEGSLDILKQKDEHEYKLVKELNELVKSRKIWVKRIFRVASPAKGTSLLSNRLDHFLNGVLSAIGLALGDKANLSYQLVRRFLMKVIKSRNNAGTMPGLKAMMEDSALSMVLNDTQLEVNAEMFYLAGNATIGSLGQTILVILSKLYFRRKNDMVVDSNSMHYGVSPKDAPYHLMLEGGDIHHLNYFRNNNTVTSLSAFLFNNQDHLKTIHKINYESDRERGALSYLFVREVYATEKISGDKPIVFILPGIMASNLAVDDERIWLDLFKIREKAITKKLKASDRGITARSVIKQYYGKLVEYLEKDYDVHVFPFDWRLSLDQTIKKLSAQVGKYKKYKQNIHFVAHSMGGVVLRNWMVNDPQDWSKKTDEQTKVIMLGTPWLGSHHILEVFSGKSRKVNIISWLSRTDKDQLLRQFTNYGGLYELLPMSDKDSFGEMDFWTRINDAVGKEDQFPLPKQKLLDSFKSLEKKVLEHEFDFERIYYIAGWDKDTICDYKIQETIFGKKLKFKKTSKGDGSVTWNLGIPAKLPKENLYFSDISHMQLADSKTIFPAIRDLLEFGKTMQLDHQANISRGEKDIYEYSDLSVSNNENEVYRILFGIDPGSIEGSEPEIPLKVDVVHADLKEASHPVMVGHFRQDGIVSAERAIDNYLDQKLSMLHTHSNYPEEIGEQEIIFCPGKSPKGAIVVGLGDSESLTSYKLSKTIEKAMLKYIFKRAECQKQQSGCEGVTSLCIGSGYAGLPMNSSLISILKGITQANKIAVSLDRNYQPIEKVEFIELFEDIANHAYHVLKALQREDDRFRFEIGSKLKKEQGARRRITYNKDTEWWHIFSTEIQKMTEGAVPYDTQIIFKSSGSRARVEVSGKYGGEDELNLMLSAIENETSWNKEIAKTMFEILIPNQLKDLIRNQSNILWKMNERAAEIPWEMIHDYEYDQNPTFINAGLIRQLQTVQYRENPVMMRKDKALIIGKLDYSGTSLSPLPQARAEAELVKKLLGEKSYIIQEPENSDGMSIFNSLFNSEFKILHIAGHGVYDPQNNKVGVVLGNGLMLSPARLESMPKVPEFVFINCCYSGSIDHKDGIYYEKRYKLAANLGVQLIKMGVEAVVVTGWAVNDLAARHFAEELYSGMLQGNYFGDAVKMARAKCYARFKQNNTWAAYQCYGNQWYQFTKDRSYGSIRKDYIDDEEVIVDLYNLNTKANKTRSDKAYIKEKLKNIISDAKRSKLHFGKVVEFEGNIYAKIDELDLAIDRFASLLKRNEAYFSLDVLEQYCHLRFKKLYRDANFDYESNKGEILAGAIDKYAPGIMEDFELLLRIGETSKRHNFIGIAYKYLSILRNSNNKKRSFYLSKMYDHFYKGYFMSKRKFDKSIYPLYNLVLAAYASQDNILINKEINGTDLSTQIDILVSDLETTKQDVKTRRRLRNLFNVNLVRYVINKDVDISLEKHILTYLDEILARELPYRYVNTETEHLVFLHVFFKEKREFLRQLIVKFQKLS